MEARGIPFKKGLDVSPGKKCVCVFCGVVEPLYHRFFLWQSVSVLGIEAIPYICYFFFVFVFNSLEFSLLLTS